MSQVVHTEYMNCIYTYSIGGSPLSFYINTQTPLFPAGDVGHAPAFLAGTDNFWRVVVKYSLMEEYIEII